MVKKECPICGSVQVSATNLVPNKILSQIIERLVEQVERREIEQKGENGNDCSIRAEQKEYVTQTEAKQAEQKELVTQTQSTRSTKNNYSNQTQSTPHPTQTAKTYLKRPIYNVMTDKQLKKYLSSHNQPVTGDRKTLIDRIDSLIIQFNANLDSGNDPSTIQIQQNPSAKRPVETFFERKHKKIDSQPQLISHYHRYKEEFDRLTQELWHRKLQQKNPGKQNIVTLE